MPAWCREGFSLGVIWGMLVKCESGGKWWVWEVKSQPVLQGFSQGKSWRRRTQRREVLSWEMRVGTPGKKQGILRKKKSVAEGKKKPVSETHHPSELLCSPSTMRFPNGNCSSGAEKKKNLAIAGGWCKIPGSGMGTVENKEQWERLGFTLGLWKQPSCQNYSFLFLLPLEICPCGPSSPESFCQRGPVCPAGNFQSRDCWFFHSQRSSPPPPPFLSFPVSASF